MKLLYLMQYIKCIGEGMKVSYLFWLGDCGLREWVVVFFVNGVNGVNRIGEGMKLAYLMRYKIGIDETMKLSYLM